MARLGKDELLDLRPTIEDPENPGNMIDNPHYGDQLLETVDDDPDTDEVDTLTPVMRESLLQAIRFEILTILGEWFLDSSLGIPYYEIIWVKRPNMDHIKSAFRTALLSVLGVRDVTRLVTDLNPRTRKLSIEWAVTTDYDELEGTVVI